MLWTLAISAVGSGAAAAVYAGIASMLWHRPTSKEGRTATRAFALYWATTGGFLALAALQNGLAAAGAIPLLLFVAARYLGLALACAGLAALVYYFAYPRTGDRRWLARIAVAYGATLALVWWQVYASRPTGVAVKRWSTDLSYAGNIEGALYLPILVMLLVVPIAGAAWYLTLVRRVDEPRQRYRIVVVALGVGLQLLGILVARLSDADLFQFLVRPVAGVVVAALVLSAFVGRETPLDR